MNNENIEKANWYVVHTYSGYENKVKTKIENMIENEKAENIFDVKVPMEEYEETKGGKKVLKERKIFPGYVLIKMIVDTRNWYLIRNTNGVTGFIGPDGEPVPLTAREIREFGIEGKDPVQVKAPVVDINVSIGDVVEISTGPFEGFDGKVEEINPEKQILKVIIDILGRDTTAEIPYADIKQQ